MKYIVCYSGGHSSALVAIEAVRKYGKENVILLNHNISSIVEHQDIKRFKQEVADYLGIKITYANMKNYEEKTPLQISLDENAFKVGDNTTLCTNRLKTKPFYDWLKIYFPVDNEWIIRDDVKILYGFDKNETVRVTRRVGVMFSMGYETEYPLISWNRTIYNVEEIGIKKPITYEIFKHANCIGCLKAGMQHWYVVYIMYPEMFKMALEAEKIIGYSIIKNHFLKDILPKFEQMKKIGIVQTEHVKYQTFWAMVRKHLKEDQDTTPCDCSF